MTLTSLLARRYVSSRRKGGFVRVIAWFSMLGIMLGVATLILVTSLMNGIRQEMLSNFVGLDGHIRVMMRGSILADYPYQVDIITPHLPKDAVIMPRIEGQVMVSGMKGRSSGAQVISLHAEDMQHKPRLLAAMSEEAKRAFAAHEGVVIGSRLAESLGVLIGDSITLISPQGRATAFGSVPRIKAYPVVGLVETGMHALDASLVLMPYEDGLRYFALTQKGANPASMLEITLPDGDTAPEVAEKLQSVLGQYYLVLSWQEVHASIFTALEVQRNVMVIILALIILVAAFNIISSLVMMVKDKRADIAILRTMGMSRKAVIRLFVLTGMSIGMIGTMLGLGLGVLAAANLESIKRGVEALLGQEILVANIYYLSTLPTKTDPLEVAVIVVMALLITLLATMYPAYKAASAHPAEALRHG